MANKSDTTCRFAYGDNVVLNCECPLLAGDYDPRDSPNLDHIAGVFDERVKELDCTTKDRSVVPNEIARDVWLDIMSDVSRGKATAIPPESEEYAIMADVAEKLGWFEINTKHGR